jgi:hypothetical protein
VGIGLPVPVVPADIWAVPGQGSRVLLFYPTNEARACSNRIKLAETDRGVGLSHLLLATMSYITETTSLQPFSQPSIFSCQVKTLIRQSLSSASLIDQLICLTGAVQLYIYSAEVHLLL